MARAAASRSSTGSRRPGRRPERGAGVGRWLLLPLGLAIALAALFALATLDCDGEGAGAGAPLDEIDRESRERLEELLREAERER